MPDSKPCRCGFIAIVGRPNVGKSTLLNRLIGKKVSITAPRAQTTRHRIVGIKTRDRQQWIFVDTPGLHLKAKPLLNKHMNKAALNAMQDVDVVVLVLEAGRWREEDEWIAGEIQKVAPPVIVVINKIDRLTDKKQLLPQIQQIADKMGAVPVVPVSAKKGQQLDELERAIQPLLPASEHFFYPEDMETDRPIRFHMAELVREKLTRRLHEELPYALTVEIEKLSDSENLVEIHALIWVDKDSQKAIIIGKNGEMMKSIATEARQELERFLQKKVVLKCWVKTKAGWMDDEKQLDVWGYVER